MKSFKDLLVEKKAVQNSKESLEEEFIDRRISFESEITNGLNSEDFKVEALFIRHNSDGLSVGLDGEIAGWWHCADIPFEPEELEDVPSLVEKLRYKFLVDAEERNREGIYDAKKQVENLEKQLKKFEELKRDYRP